MEGQCHVSCLSSCCHGDWSTASSVTCTLLTLHPDPSMSQTIKARHAHEHTHSDTHTHKNTLKLSEDCLIRWLSALWLSWYGVFWRCWVVHCRCTASLVVPFFFSSQLLFCCTFYEWRNTLLFFLKTSLSSSFLYTATDNVIIQDWVQAKDSCSEREQVIAGQRLDWYCTGIPFLLFLYQETNHKNCQSHLVIVISKLAQNQRLWNHKSDWLELRSS